jgi:predicted  nucleic acid-binding Zn-ribbon protein
MDVQQEIQRMENRLNDIEGRLNHIENKMDSIDSKVSRMYNALVGDEVMKTQGLVSRIERAEQSVKELKEFKRKIIYSVAAIVALGLVIDFFVRLYTNLGK